MNLPFPSYQVIITDENSTTVTYIGYAQSSPASTSEAIWAILRITQTASSSPVGVTLYEWATGKPELFSNVWTSRTGLSYQA